MTTRLFRLASILRRVLWAAILLVVLAPSLGWLVPDIARGLPAMLLGGADLPAAHRLIGLAIAMPPFLVVAFGLAQLQAFCRRVGDRRMFSRAAATALRRLGWALLAASLLLPLSRIGLWWLLGGGAAPQSLGDWMMLLPALVVAIGVTFGLVFILFAAVLDEAARLAEENAGFV